MRRAPHILTQTYKSFQHQPPPSLRHLHATVLSCLSLFSVKQSHVQAAVSGLLDLDLPLTATLILAYSDFEDPESSLRLFDRSPPDFRRRAFLWNALVRAHTKAGLHDGALEAYNSMLTAGVRPDNRTFPFVLKACADAREERKGREVHGAALRAGYGGDVFVGNTLLTFYGACGMVHSAAGLFAEMAHRDVVSFNSLMSVLSDNGCPLESIKSFLELARSCLAVNEVSVVGALTACIMQEDALAGRWIHGYAVKSGLDCQVTVANAFVDMYAKCGDTESAVQVFSAMPEKNDVSWNSVIGGLVHVGRYLDSLSMLRDMLSEGMMLNCVTISILLPAMLELGYICLGKEIHGHSMRTGMDDDVFVSNSLLDMYAKSGQMKEASDIFYRMQNKNAVSWNVMIANCTQNKAETKALELVKEMQAHGEIPNAGTFTNVLPACSRLSYLNLGKEIHSRAIRVGVSSEIYVSNALIDMYAKCRCLELARNVFEISEKDDVSYNTLIVGYSQVWECSEALCLFEEMRSKGLGHDPVSFLGALSACANMSAIKLGKEIHGFLVRRSFHRDLFIANSLLDFYTRCARIDIARQIFDRIPSKDAASWNGMILGYAMQGELETAFELFDSMKADGVCYDSVSFIAILSACSHSGLVDRGKIYFKQMVSFGIQPTQTHYACMVDLLGRAGLLKEAVEFINCMPLQPDFNVWGALLGACRIYGDLEFGRLAAEHLFVLKPEHSGYYAILSNMYADAGMWSESNEIRQIMRVKGVKKNEGCSWVQLAGRMHAAELGKVKKKTD